MPGFAQWVLPDGGESDRCPFGLVTPLSQYTLKLHAFYARGLLPFAGGVAAQPSWLLDAFAIIDNEEATRRPPAGGARP